EALQLVLREVHAAERRVLLHVTHDVDQLQRDPERVRALDVVAAVDGDARDSDGAGDLLAVPAQLVEGRVPLLREILEAAVDERAQRVARDAKALARVRERN